MGKVKYVGKAVLKTVDEVKNDVNTTIVEHEAGITLVHATGYDFIYPYEQRLLGTEVDVYTDGYNFYDFIPIGEEYHENRIDAIYAVTDYGWLVKED